MLSLVIPIVNKTKRDITVSLVPTIFHWVKMVDQRRKTWNTFIEISLEWEPILKQIYDNQDCELDSG